jgi:hypothetical protein
MAHIQGVGSSPLKGGASGSDGDSEEGQWVKRTEDFHLASSEGGGEDQPGMDVDAESEEVFYK